MEKRILIAPGTLRDEIPAVTWDNVIVGRAAILESWSIATRRSASCRR